MRIATVINSPVIWAATPCLPNTAHTLTGITRMSTHWEAGPRHAEHPFPRGNSATLATQVADHIGVAARVARKQE
jgi:hypothetical protein